MHLSECASVADVSIFLVKSSAILAHFLVLYMLAVLTGMYRILAYFAKEVKIPSTFLGSRFGFVGGW